MAAEAPPAAAIDAGAALVSAGSPSAGGNRAALPMPRALRLPPVLSPHNSSRVFLAAPAGGSRQLDAPGIVPVVKRTLLTLALVAAAVVAALAVARGTDPALMAHERGLEWIALGRRLQWPLAAVSLACCAALIGLVVAGRRRVFWLLALAPVLYLFYSRFTADPWRRLGVTDAAPFVAAGQAKFVKPETPVVGMMVGETPYCYPVAALARTPVIVHAEAERRVIVMYSPFAGRVRAFAVDHTIRARELDIVSMPANAMLLYNGRIGQFINAFTGQTPDGQRPDGFGAAVETTRGTFRQWVAQHPDTKVLASAPAANGEKVQPQFPFPPSAGTAGAAGGLAPEARVALVQGPAGAVAVQAEKVPPTGDVAHVTAGGLRAVLVRDRAGGHLRAYDGAVQGDLFPRFQRTSVPRKPEVAFVDSDTGSLWSSDFKCLEGPAKGQALKPLGIEPDLPVGTLLAFCRDVEVAGKYDVSKPAQVAPPAPELPARTRPSGRGAGRS